jgi:hypothetical protein
MNEEEMDRVTKERNEEVNRAMRIYYIKAASIIIPLVLLLAYLIAFHSLKESMSIVLFLMGGAFILGLLFMFGVWIICGLTMAPFAIIELYKKRKNIIQSFKVSLVQFIHRPLKEKIFIIGAIALLIFFIYLNCSNYYYNGFFFGKFRP